MYCRTVEERKAGILHMPTGNTTLSPTVSIPSTPTSGNNQDTDIYTAGSNASSVGYLEQDLTEVKQELNPNATSLDAERPSGVLEIKPCTDFDQAAIKVENDMCFNTNQSELPPHNLKTTADQSSDQSRQTVNQNLDKPTPVHLKLDLNDVDLNGASSQKLLHADIKCPCCQLVFTNSINIQIVQSNTFQSESVSIKNEHDT